MRCPRSSRRTARQNAEAANRAKDEFDRAQGGLGLGLAIVDNLVRLHRGTVTAQSQGPGHGSEFTVRLPAQGTPSAVTRPAYAPRAIQHGGARILIVDDNVDAAQLLADLLEAAGYRTLAAHDGPSALDAAEAFHPEVASQSTTTPCAPRSNSCCAELTTLAADRRHPVAVGLEAWPARRDRP